MRLAPIAPGDMTLEQRKIVVAAVAGRRGAMPAPLMPWLRSPLMAKHAERLGESIRFDLTLPARLVAIAAMIVAAHWRAAYVWQAQTTKARSEGLSESVIAAIERGEMPDFTETADAGVHRIICTLIERRGLDLAAYAEAVALLGEQGLVELIAAFGYYNLVAVTDAVFELPTG